MGAFFLDIGKYFHDEFGNQGIGSGLRCPNHVHGRYFNKGNFRHIIPYNFHSAKYGADDGAA
jgi:hypothetical protein